MTENSESFKTDLQSIRDFLIEKRKLANLAKNANVSIRSVQNTFKVESFSELKGSKLRVYQEAIRMVEEIKGLQEKAKQILEA